MFFVCSNLFRVCKLNKLHNLIHRRRIRTLFPKFFTAHILFWEYLGVVCFRPKNQSFFVGKRTSYTFPWTRDSQCQNSANSLAENTPNASKNFSPICLPKPKSFEFLKKKALWMSVVRDYYNQDNQFYNLFFSLSWKKLCNDKKQNLDPAHWTSIFFNDLEVTWQCFEIRQKIEG